MLSRTLIIWEKEDVRFDLVCENETSRSVDNRTVRARQGLNIQKKEISSGYLLFCIIESARRDSNSPNVGKATKIKEECTLSNVCLQAVYNLEIRVESCQGVCRADTFYPFTACYSGR